MYIGELLNNLHATIWAPDEFTPNDLEDLIRDDPQNVQIEMRPNEKGEYVLVGITYLFDSEF